MYSIYKVSRTPQEWQKENGLVLFTWSIINPNGPTLSCVGIRNSGSPGQIEVFYRWLHFLGGESFVLGYLTEQSENIKEELLEILDMPHLPRQAYGFKFKKSSGVWYKIEKKQ